MPRVKIDPAKLGSTEHNRSDEHYEYFYDEKDGEWRRRQHHKGFPPHEPSDEDRELVAKLAGIGLGILDIAVVIGISHPTLTKHYTPDLERGRAQVKAIVANKLFQLIREGNFNAIQFFMRTRMGWTEKGDEAAESDDSLGKMSDEELEREIAAIESRKRIAASA